MERERKWLFNEFPQDQTYIEESIYKQAYLNVEPEFRIRSKQPISSILTTYKLCIKGKGTLERIEVEKDLTKSEFNELMIVGNISNSNFIYKYTRVYLIDNQKLYISSVDKDRDSKFMYGEIEFNTIEEANKFIAPDWFGKEVTDDQYYYMANYWNRTRNQSIDKIESLLNNNINVFKYIDWSELLNDMNLSTEFLERNNDKLHFNTIIQHTKLSEDNIMKFRDKMDWFSIIQYQELSEDFIRKIIQSDDFLKFIEHYNCDDIENVIWRYISKYQKLSEEFIREFQDKVDWMSIFILQELSDEFIKEFRFKFDKKKSRFYYIDIDKKKRFKKLKLI